MGGYYNRYKRRIGYLPEQPLLYMNKNAIALTLALYRRDGSFFLADVDGTPTALCAREGMTKLCEAVYAVTLGSSTDETKN